MTAPSAVAFSIGGWNIYWYGILIASSVLLGFLLAMHRARKYGLNPDLIVDFLLLAIPLAVVGARLYYVAFTWESYAADPISILYIWQGGVAFYGALIGGAVAALIFAKWKKIKLLELLDICIPSVILGQAIGRWGNFFNQEAFGAAVTNPSMQWFPFAVYIEALAGTPEGPWHYATFFYESMWCLIVFATLLIFSRKPRKYGSVFAMYLSLYGLGRFFIEGLRTDSLYIGSLRVSQILSLLLFLGAGVWFVMMMVRSEREKEEMGSLTPDLRILSGARTPVAVQDEEDEAERADDRADARDEIDARDDGDARDDREDAEDRDASPDDERKASDAPGEDRATGDDDGDGDGEDASETKPRA